VRLLANVSEIINPRQSILVTCRGNADGVLVRHKKSDSILDNIITVDWHTPLSFNPAMYGIVIGKTRFSYRLISESGVFAVNFMPFSHKDAVLFCGRTSGIKTDKFAESGLTKTECAKIDCPRIKEASAYLECEVVNQIETGDHVMFIGRVLNAELLHYEKRIFHTGNDDFTTTQD